MGGDGGGASALRPVASVSKGAGDVLAELAAASSAAGQGAYVLDAGGADAGAAAQAGGASAGGSGGGDHAAVTFGRIAPCLLPEQEQVGAVRVTGPRYWRQVLERSGGRGRGPSLAALYATRTLFLQRKAGALPYADDPTGVRSLLSRMAHHQGGPSASGGQGGGQGGALADSFDLVNLCATFGSDPCVMGFAHVRCAAGACALLAWLGVAGGGLAGGRGALLRGAGLTGGVRYSLRLE